MLHRPATARRSTRKSPVPSKAASRSRWRVAAGRPVMRDANPDWRRRLSGRRPGRASAAACCRLLSATGSSSSARGFPCASAIRRRRTRTARAGKRWTSRPSAEASPSGATSCAGSPLWSKKLSTTGRAVHSMRTPVPARRRATSPRTRALAGSWADQGAGRVQAVHVVDGEQGRGVVRDLAEERRHGSDDRFGFGRRAVLPAQGHGQGIVEDERGPAGGRRGQEPPQAAVAQVRLVLHPGCGNDTHAALGGPGRGGGQQRGLAYAGLPQQQQRGAGSHRSAEEGIDPGQVGLTAHQRTAVFEQPGHGPLSGAEGCGRRRTEPHHFPGFFGRPRLVRVIRLHTDDLKSLHDALTRARTASGSGPAPGVPATP